LTARGLPVRLAVRSTLACAAALILAGAGVFWWQRSQNALLREQIAEQGEALQSNQRRMEDLSLLLIAQNRGGMDGQASLRPPAGTGRRRSTGNESAALRADERRLIMDQYSDVLAGMNLPAATASRLQDLLADRIEAVLDAQDAALQEGFAEGSAETARAVALAIDEVDRDIAGLVGADGIRRLDGIPSAVPPEPALIFQPPAPVTVVTVVVQAPGAPDTADAAAGPAVSDAYPLYSPFLYFPVASVVTGPRSFRPFDAFRTAIVRPHRPYSRSTDR
jgi:hypothetical protein